MRDLPHSFLLLSFSMPATQTLESVLHEVASVGILQLIFRSFPPTFHRSSISLEHLYFLFLLLLKKEVYGRKLQSIYKN